MREEHACTLKLSGETLALWQDRLLSAQDLARLDAHVPACAACQQRAGQFADNERLLRRQRELEPGNRIWRGVQMRVPQSPQHRIFLMQSRTVWRSAAAAVALILLAALLSQVLHPKGGHSVTTTLPTQTPTATSVPATCARELPGAGPASAGISFPALPLPANSVSTAPTKIAGGGDGEFTIWQLELCTPGSNSTALNAFFGQTTKVWLQSNTFPADGSYQSTCPDGDCRASGQSYYRFVPSVTDVGNGVERYHLLLATPPPAPTCNSLLFSSQLYYYKISDTGETKTQPYADVPFPPLSRDFNNDAAGGQRGVDICSAGTPESVAAFVNTYLPRLGWTNVGNGAWKNGVYSLDISIPSATDWTIKWHDPNFG